jgi:RNA polymerase sigma-70 factor (ECF subfamily)
MSIDATTIWMSRFRKGDETHSDANLGDLIERAATGDASAFEQIVVRTERRVLLLAFRMLGNMADAEDATQEVFLRAYKYLHRFDRRRPLEPWLIRMTINVCRDIRRKRKVQTEEVFDVPREAPDAHSEVALDEQKGLLRLALAKLPEKERAVLILRDLEGRPTREVAEILGTSESTVRAQLSNARMKVKQLLAKLNRG